jgi:hypothetical protein
MATPNIDQLRRHFAKQDQRLIVPRSESVKQQLGTHTVDYNNVVVEQHIAPEQFERTIDPATNRFVLIKTCTIF